MVGVVQLAEHWIVVPGVVGSSPFWRATFLDWFVGQFSKLHMVDIAQLVSASDCGSEGRGFESLTLRQNNSHPIWGGNYFIEERDSKGR